MHHVSNSWYSFLCTSLFYLYLHFSADTVWLWYTNRFYCSSLQHLTMVCCSLIISRKQYPFHRSVIILRCFSKSKLFLMYQTLPLNSRLAPANFMFLLLVSLPLLPIPFLLISFINLFIYLFLFSCQPFPEKLPQFALICFNLLIL